MLRSRRFRSRFRDVATHWRHVEERTPFSRETDTIEEICEVPELRVEFDTLHSQFGVPETVDQTYHCEEVEVAHQEGVVSDQSSYRIDSESAPPLCHQIPRLAEYTEIDRCQALLVTLQRQDRPRP